MEEKDIDEVVEIERDVFEHPWSRNFFRIILSDINNHVLTLRKGKTIIGYGGYHFLKTHKNFLHTQTDYKHLIHLINIAIMPHFQHKGCGTFLMHTLIDNARLRKADYCYLEARSSNNRAMNFYKKTGFLIIGVIENYYPNEHENAIVMGKKLL
jgi:ribosomal-protein-alanine N-acetyltransferase